MTGFTSKHTIYGTERTIRTVAPGKYRHSSLVNPNGWSNEFGVENCFGVWRDAINAHILDEKIFNSANAGKFVASNGIVVDPNGNHNGNAVNFSRIPGARESQTVPLNVLEAYQEFLERPDADLPRPEVGENIWLEILYGGATPGVYVGTVRKWDKDSGEGEYLVLDSLSGNYESAWWPGTVPDDDGYTVVVAWGLVEPEPEPLVLEHREGEYLHLANESESYNWTLTHDGKEWFQNDLDRHPYSNKSAQKYAEGAGGYHVVSHGFLEGTTKKVKWPEGATIKTPLNRIVTLAEDVYEGDTRFTVMGYAGWYPVQNHQRVEITVVD